MQNKSSEAAREALWARWRLTGRRFEHYRSALKARFVYKIKIVTKVLPNRRRSVLHGLLLGFVIALCSAPFGFSAGIALLVVGLGVAIAMRILYLHDQPFRTRLGLPEYTLPEAQIVAVVAALSAPLWTVMAIWLLCLVLQ